MKKAAVLCARAQSVYFDLEGLDVFDSGRDAFTFAGGMPVIAHPPCRLWGNLFKFAKPQDEQRERALALFCVDSVRQCGGVLEHPAGSKLWKAANLPLPGRLRSGAREFTISIDQSWFGHRAPKRTWLFIAGVLPRDIPPIPFCLAKADYFPVEHMGKREREATPPALAHWLVSLASRVSPCLC